MNNNPALSVDKREYGVDIVKIIATFLVVATHMFTFGGFFELIDPLSPKGFILGFFRGITLCCVNLFGISTGYVYYNRKMKLSKILSFWLQVVFLSVAILITHSLISGRIEDIKLNLFPTLLPVIYGKYWFFNSYIVVMLLSNYFNKLINVLSKKEYSVLLVSLFVVLVILPGISGREDLFKCSIQYSFVWLSFCCLCGMYIKKYELIKKIKTVPCLIISFISVLILPLYSVIYTKYPFSVFSGDFENLTVIYNSFNIIILSLALFIIISKIKIKNSIAKKFVIALSSTSFTVYIIHCNNFIMDRFIRNQFMYLSDNSTVIILLKIIAFAFIIFISCSIIGYVQIQLFRLIKVDSLCKTVEGLIHKALNKLIGRDEFDGRQITDNGSERSDNPQCR